MLGAPSGPLQTCSDSGAVHPLIPEVSPAECFSISSWELGTRAQALLELDAPSYSVLTRPVTVPPPSFNASSNASLADVLSIARNAVAALSSPPSNGIGRPLFAGDSSAADPASIGVAVLIANWTNLAGEDYAGAGTAQVEYLLGSAVPKTDDGAISHRVEQVQLWYANCTVTPSS